MQKPPRYYRPSGEEFKDALLQTVTLDPASLLRAYF